MKRILLILLVFCMLAHTALAAGTFSVQPAGDGSIQVTGTKDAEKATTILIYKDNLNNIVSIRQLGAGEGEFTEYLPIGAADGLVYTVRINGEDITDVENISAADALTRLNAAAASAFADVLESYNAIFKADTSLIEPVYDKTAVYESLAAKSFSAPENVAAEYAAAVADVISGEKEAALSLIASGKAAEALANYLQHFEADKASYDSLKNKTAVSNALNGKTYTEQQFLEGFADALILARLNEASGTAFKELAKANQDKIGLDLSATADAVFAKAQDRNFASYDGLKDILIEETSLYNVNSASRETIKSVLEAENDVLGILDTEGYSQLTSSQKESACLALAGGNYASVDAAKEEFYKIITSVKNQGSGTSSSPGSSSSGGNSYGFSGGGVSTPVTPVTPGTSDVALPFEDISVKHWGYSSVASLYTKGIISGTSETTFEPDREIKREEFVKMLVNTFDLYNEAAVNVFADIPYGDWCEKFVASAYDVGLTLGKGDGTFGRGDTLTRQDMAVMAVRCADIAGLTLDGEAKSAFADEAEFAAYAKESIYTLYRAGIINGIGNGLFSPSSGCTRAMAAKVCDALYSLYKGGAA